ncbi:MAG: hypothetical protein B7Z35_02100 [Hydrogenophilales bacterium 12-61-10]|nr:MAG: hypothetical protein B7Z35_02100 [Hydrogenophilales bacterium 12-61-10]OYX29108.1 MAG: hypothetical protein B7Z03_10035 [Hydrogenophilales bacterium 32-62-9]
MSWEIILLIGFGGLGWYWYAGLNTREQAVAVGRRACNDGKLQFLDDSVALSRTRFARNNNGQLQFLRDYRFEFSDTGNNRRPGVIRMLGNRVEWVSLDGEWQPGHSAAVTRLPD